MASFLARRTMFSIMAPEAKSLKNITSLSPFWYVTSRNRLRSSSRYISSTVVSIIARTALSGSPPPRSVDLVLRRGAGRRSGSGWKIGRRRLLVGPLDLDLHVEAARAQDGRVDQVLAVGGADHDDVLQGLDPVDLGQQLRDDGRLHVGADAGAPGAEQRVHLVEEDDDGDALLGLLPGPLEDQADLALGLAHVLVEQLGALDVEEVAAGLGVAAELGHLLGQRVGHGLGDERLAAARGAVEEDALGRRQLVLGEQVLVDEGQLDGVGDLLDLVVQAADVGRRRRRAPPRGPAPRPRAGAASRAAGPSGCP